MLFNKASCLRIFSLLTVVFFISILFFTDIMKVKQTQASVLGLPEPTKLLNLSIQYSHPVLKGLSFDPANPLQIKFIVDSKDHLALTVSETSKLVRYFLAGLTIPENQLWVNLSPYEQNRICADDLAQTDLGRDMLGQDYVLKQLSSSLMYPEQTFGKQYWSHLYGSVSQTDDLSSFDVDTFNKVWILPDEAAIYEKDNSVLLTEAKLTAMLEKDYLAMSKSSSSDTANNDRKQLQAASSNAMKKFILPQIIKDINHGKNFANLRQIYNSLVLAIWFKNRFKQSFFRDYFDNSKVSGVELDDPKARDKIFDLYVQSFSKGAFNLVKKTYDQANQEYVKRRYNSGGLHFVEKIRETFTSASALQVHDDIKEKEELYAVDVDLQLVYRDSDGSGPDISIPEYLLQETAHLFAKQDANIVFEKHHKTGEWVFRRGPIDLKADPAFINAFARTMYINKRSSILLSFRSHDKKAIHKALRDVFSYKDDIVTCFAKHGIKSFYDYKKVLLVAPFGDMNGNPLKYKVPHKGVETIAAGLIRKSDDVDAVVYNANIGSREDLYNFVANKDFDVIGVSILQTVLKANLEILGRLALDSPESLFIAGGFELNKFPLDRVAQSWPVDVLSFDNGQSFFDVVDNVELGSTKSENLERINSVANIGINTGDNFKKTEKVNNKFLNIDFATEKEIAYDDPDIIHGRTYDKAKTEEDLVPIAFDRIGRKPSRIHLGDYCKGKCIFCGTHRNKMRDISPDKVIELIAKRDPSTDSIHFESADFLYDPKSAKRLVRELSKYKDVKKIPKLAIARVDEIGDGTILKDMASAGFKIVAYGIESFDDKVLEGLGKETTGKQNMRALDLSIKAGIKPGLNLILFSPWDTIDTTLLTIDKSIEYIKRGAYINVVPYLFAGYGRKISRMEEILDYETFDFPGFKKPFKFPAFTKIYDSKLAKLQKEVFSRLSDLEEINDYPEWVNRSVSIYSLLVYDLFINVLAENKMIDQHRYDDYKSRIKSAIDRVIRVEESTLKHKYDPLAFGVLETHFSPHNQIMTRAILKTEDGREIALQMSDIYNARQIGVAGEVRYSINVIKENDGTQVNNYKGDLVLDMNTNDELNNWNISFRREADIDAYLSRVIASFADVIADDGMKLYDENADFRKTGHDSVVHYHRLPSEPLFGEFISRAVSMVAQEDFKNQLRATTEQGYGEFSSLLSKFVGETISDEHLRSRFSPPVSYLSSSISLDDFITPDLAISDMDLTQFPDDANAPRVMVELAQKAIKYKSAAISVYPHHLKFLPVDDLKKAGVHIGVVVAFPKGLGYVDDIAHELSILEEAVKNGADEVDFVMDFNAVINGNISKAEKSLAEFALGVESIKIKHKAKLRTKVIIETTALNTEENLRAATRLGLKYADLIKMVTGFPVASDNNQFGRGTLWAAEIILNEIDFYYKQTGILRAFKITGGINQWDNPIETDRSARNYYKLVLKILGKHLGAHYIFERDLFRIGGYGSLPTFLEASTEVAYPLDINRVNFEPSLYEDLKIAKTEDETSLNVGAYLSSKFPKELLDAFANKERQIEIHRASLASSESYIQHLVYQGYDVTPLVDVPSAPPHHKFYRLDKDGHSKYVIIGLLGKAREQFIVQAISQYYEYPSDKISFLELDDGAFEQHFSAVLGTYTGKIDRAVLLHEIDSYVEQVNEGSGVKLDIVERIKSDYVDAIVATTQSGEKVLLFEMQYANGSHAGVVVDYFAKPIEENGLAVKDITLHGACGGIGDEINVNDVIVYDNIYWKGKQQTDIPVNAVDYSRLKSLLPNGVQPRVKPIFDIPTVLNGSIKTMDEIDQLGGGAIELEAAHGATAAAKYDGVTFRAFYEVHDKPATSRTLSKKDAIGDDIAGYRDPAKRYNTWRALASYLFDVKEKSSSIGDDLIRTEIDSEKKLYNVERDIDYIQQRVIRDLGNVVFLGNGHGSSYFLKVNESWNREEDGEILYWDAKEHEPFLDMGVEFWDILPKGVGSERFFDTLTGKFSKRTIFIDNFDVLLTKHNQQEALSLLSRMQKDVPIIGYMGATKYHKVENYHSNDLEVFKKLNFELSSERIKSMKDKKVVVLGATGLVGREIMRQLKDGGYSNVHGVSLSGDSTLNVESVDLTDPIALREAIDKADYVINAAVNLDFPGMQSGGDARQRAYEVNVGIAKTVSDIGFKGKFVQLSSFYVFGHNNGEVLSTTQAEPISVYGKHKFEAEQIVDKMPDSMTVRLGPLFGIDSSGRQKGFYSSVVKQLEDLSKGKDVQPITVTTYPVSPIISVRDVAKGTISLMNKNFNGIAQLSGMEKLDSVQQAHLIADVYNEMFSTNLNVSLNVVSKSREGSLTPDASMKSLVSPDLRSELKDLIREYIDASLGSSGILASKRTDQIEGGVDFKLISSGIKSHGMLDTTFVDNLKDKNISGLQISNITISKIKNHAVLKVFNLN